MVLGLRGGWGRSGVGRRWRRPATRHAPGCGEGRYDEAFAAHARPGADPLDADDLFALGTALLRRDRLVLGWTALEAARRIDPGHAATDRKLDELEGKLVVAVEPRAGGVARGGR